MGDLRPRLADMVVYRGKLGLQTHRAAVVTATVDTLDERGVAAGEIQALSSPGHVHLWVFGAGGLDSFAEYDVPPGVDNAELDPGQYRPARCRCR